MAVFASPEISIYDFCGVNLHRTESYESMKNQKTIKIENTNILETTLKRFYLVKHQYATEVCIYASRVTLSLCSSGVRHTFSSKAKIKQRFGLRLGDTTRRARNFIYLEHIRSQQFAFVFHQSGYLYTIGLTSFYFGTIFIAVTFY